MNRAPSNLRSPVDTASVPSIIRELASFRYSLRKFLRFSEKAARQFGVTPQQHQLMLGVAGFTGRGTASVSELAEFLQERHHSVVELIERAVQNGLVYRGQDVVDRRVVVVSLTRLGEETLAKLSTLHQEEITRVRAGFLNISEDPVLFECGRRKSMT
jgi:DNA-binding MarR family transcriptional regulator